MAPDSGENSTAFVNIPAALPEAVHASIEWAKFPQCEAMLWFAKGLGAARSGNLDQADIAIGKLAEIVSTLADKKLTYWMKLATAQQQAVEAWVALGRGAGFGNVAANKGRRY